MMDSVKFGPPELAASSDQLAEFFLASWTQANGASESRVEVLAGQDRFVILIEGAFTKAERALAEGHSAEQTLRQYLKGLMDIIAEQAVPYLDGMIGRKARALGTDVNFEGGWVLWYFSLETSANNT